MTDAIAIRGNTLQIRSKCWLDKDSSIIADLAGATFTSILKRNPRDKDSDAILTKTLGAGVTVVAPASGGIFLTVFTAAETNVLVQNKIYFEGVVKLADGSFLRTGIQEINIEGNVLSTLF